MVHLIKSTKGGFKLVDELSHIYRLDKKCGPKTHWKCQTVGCKARVTSLEEENKVHIIKSLGEHSHPSNPSTAKAHEAKGKMKSLAHNSMLSSKSIIAQAASTLDVSDLALLPLNSSLSRNIRIWRQSMVPPIPSERSGFEIPLDYTTLDNGVNFLLHDSGEFDVDRFLVFGTQSGLNDLTNIREWACDGTFEVAPALNYQPFTLHAVVHTFSVARLFVLLPNKNESSFRRLFQILKEIHPRLNPHTLMIDFEKGLMNAFREVFPETIIRGGFFHLAKNVYKQIVDFGFRERYCTESEFNVKLKCFTALAFLPVEDVINGFEELCDDDDLPQELVSYFEMTYIGGQRGAGERRRRVQPTFPILVWNMYLRTQLLSTNSSVEDSHNALQSAIASSAPNLWKFIDLIKKQEALSMKRITDIQGGNIQSSKKKHTDLHDRLLNTLVTYNPNNKLNYLKNISRNLHSL